MAVALSRMKTLISFWIIIPVAPRRATIMAAISFFRDMRSLAEILISLMSRASISMWRTPDHRITLLTPVDMNGLTGFNSIDGSTWNPFSQTLLFTQEDGANGGVIEMGADFDPNTGGGAGLRTLYGSLGRGGYEGIHPDDRGNILIIEDVGGTYHRFMKLWKKSEFVCLPIRSYISGRSHSRQIAGAPGLDQRQPGRVRASGHRSIRRATCGRRTNCCSTRSAHPGRSIGLQFMTPR